MEGNEYTKNAPNVPFFDRHRKELLSLYNETLSNCSGKIAEERKYFDKVIEAFIGFVTKCFSAEEQVLSQKNCAEYDAHKLAHTKLLETIRLVKREVEAGTWEMNLIVLTKTVKNWLVNHFNAYDAEAQEYFRDEQANAGDARLAF